MRRRAALAAISWLLLAPRVRAADAALLPAVDDLQELAAQSAPRLAEQQRRSKPEYLLREVDITSRRSVGAIDGRALTEAQLADRYGVRFAPVLMAFDSRWRPLGEPLVGLDRAGFYESYVERLISEARQSQATR